MWIKFDLDGMIFEFRISNYIPNQTIDDCWANVSYYFCFQDVIKYSANTCELLLNYEVDEIRDYIEKLLNDKLKESISYECIEPSFNFIFNPKYDIRNDPNILYVKPGHEVVDIEVELKVNLWNGRLTANYFSTTLYRKEIEYLYLYLSLVTKKIGIKDVRIQELLTAGIIYGEIK